MKNHKFRTLSEEFFFNTFFMTCFVIIVAAVFISIILCRQCVSKDLQKTRYEAYVYAQNVKSLISESISRTNCIVNYTYIIDGLNTGFTNVKSRLVFIEDIKSYLSHLMPAEISDKMVIIYTSNTTIPNSQYIRQLSALDNYAYLSNAFKTENTNLKWDSNIFSNENKKLYIQYYRTIATNSTNIVSSVIYLPVPNESSIQVCANNGSIATRDTIKADINEYFSVVNKIDTFHLLREQIFIVLSVFLLAVVIICLLYFISYILTRGVTNDITKLIEDISNDIIDDSSFEELSSDYEEIKSIKNIIHSLLLKYNASEHSRYEYTLEKKHTELELMQRKIDSHTLYNSLSAIKLNALKSKDTKTIALINSLVSYYRAILNNGLDIVTLKDELSMLEYYVHINECSHDKSYPFEISADDASLNVEVPHLMLLPFVENAIMHGLAGKCENCELSIECTLLNNVLTVVLQDNGYGINEQTRLGLNDIENSNVGYGIRNSYQRMKLFYGNNVQLHYNNIKPHGTEVVITIGINP